MPRAVTSILPYADASETDVRKAVILTLVDFFFANEEAFLPLLADLAPAKLRLVEMYIQKGGRDGVTPPKYEGSQLSLTQLMHEKGLNSRRSTFAGPR